MMLDSSSYSKVVSCEVDVEGPEEQEQNTVNHPIKSSSWKVPVLILLFAVT